MYNPHQQSLFPRETELLLHESELLRKIEAREQLPTMEVPCGRYSIFDPEMLVPEFCRAVYLVINEHSDWDTGVSDVLSNAKIAKFMNVNFRGQVLRGIHCLIKEGWLSVAGKRESDGAFFYEVTHHLCDPTDVPLDPEGHPLKCAVPKCKGSASDLLAQGKITWRMMTQWTTYVVNSDWETGFVRMPILKTQEQTRLSMNTISQNNKALAEVGLLKKHSKDFEASVFELFPGPDQVKQQTSSETES